MVGHETSPVQSLPFVRAHVLSDASRSEQCPDMLCPFTRASTKVKARAHSGKIGDVLK